MAGKVAWRKDDYKGKVPSFFTSASPIIANGMCIAQLGSDRSGALIAYQLSDGQEKWKWTGDGAAYASPVLAKFGDVPAIVSEMKSNIVAVGVNDGKVLWETPFAVRYNACTPLIDGSTIIFSGAGSGTKAVKIEKAGDAFAGKPVWSNSEIGVQFDTPVVHDGLIFGLSDRDRLFCLDAATGKTAWSTELKRNRGYGSIVDAGSVMFALAPSADLIVFEPNAKEFKQLATYKVAAGDTYAYPVISGHRIFIKDKDALTLWSLE
jgi:outer membrane protein assembly factor BamB